MRPLLRPAVLPDEAGRRWAIVAESLFLANLLIAPGLAFVVLLSLGMLREVMASPLARGHRRQTVVASLWAGGLLCGLVTAILLGADQAPTVGWVMAIIALVVVHSALVLCGIVGLARAMAGQPFRYPLIGPEAHP